MTFFVFGFGNVYVAKICDTVTKNGLMEKKTYWRGEEKTRERKSINELKMLVRFYREEKSYFKIVPANSVMGE